jgi:hypothetical protein
MPEIIELEVNENTVSCNWWSPEIQEFFCDLCEKNGTEKCDKKVCGVGNPWCG